jgi:hypothetical protein
MSKPGSFSALQTPFLDNGQISWTWLQQLRVWQQLLSQGFDPSGSLTANISPNAMVLTRATIGTLFQHIDNAGVVQSAGLIPATSAAQGAVILPAGATSNTLGTAAIQPSTAFDPSGAAAAAQTGAQGFATTAANTAQANAQAFASNASNLTSGIIAAHLLPGISTTITTAKLTTGGTQGSMTFVNGLLTAQVQAT